MYNNETYEQLFSLIESLIEKKFAYLDSENQFNTDDNIKLLDIMDRHTFYLYLRNIGIDGENKILKENPEYAKNLKVYHNNAIELNQKKEKEADDFLKNIQNILKTNKEQ